MAYCRRCREPKPCACKPYNAIREKGEPGPQGDPAVIPTFTVTVVEGPVGVIIGGTATAVTIEYSQPSPDTTLDYTWLGDNTFTGATEFQGALVVEVGDGTDDGLYLPGTTLTTVLIVTGSTNLSGSALFDQAAVTFTEVTSEGFVYLSGPTSFQNLVINGPLTISHATMPPIAVSLGTVTPSFITGSTQIGHDVYLDSCGLLKQANSGVITQPLRLEPAYPFSTTPVSGDGDEHVLFYSTIAVGEPECGLTQTALADLTALIDVLAQVAATGDRWTIRMRLDDPATGTILDSFEFYTVVTGSFATWPDTRVLLRNIAAPIATGVTAIYFTAQSENSGVDDLLVFADTPTQPKLTVQ